MKSEYLLNLVETLFKTEITHNDNLNTTIPYIQVIQNITTILTQAKVTKNQLFFIGNGGSAGIAEHMSADFLKNGEVITRNLHSPSLVTCMGNDYAFEYIFSKSISLLASEGDILVAISSSGNSLNIINAIKEMKKQKGSVITFSGFKADNKIRKMGDVNIYVPIEHYGIVESIHQIILQQIVDEL